jgi:uncharacterized protein (DUF1499 family)
MESSSKRWLLFTGAGYLALLLIIQLLALPLALESMPENCPSDSQNCVHSSQSQSFRTELAPLRINASIESVMQGIEEWEEDLWFAKIVTSNESTIRLVHRTPLMQYPDDVFISLECREGMVDVTFHGQSRLGKGDIGKNVDRFADFHAAMSVKEYTGSCAQ